jgi:hypothetical protein
MAKKKLKDRTEQELHELQSRVNTILREKSKKRRVKLTLSDDDENYSHGRCGGRCGNGRTVGRCGGRC